MSGPRRTPGGLLGLVVVVALLTGVWLISDRSSDGLPDDSSGAATPTVSASPEIDSEVDSESGLPLVALDDLPPEAAETVDLIDHGGGFPYDEDGGPFGNREGLLPDEGAGYYREYTVRTPGSPDRGARRIVAGDGGELYWTADHYASFSRIIR